MSAARKKIKPVKSDWQQVILVCRKCSRKLDGGFGPDGDLSLAKALRRELPHGGIARKKTRQAVIEIGCLDVCPKGAVVAVGADTPEEWLVIPRGTPIAEVAEKLGISTDKDKP